MIWQTMLILLLVLWSIGKGWRFFIEVSENLR